MVPKSPNGICLYINIYITKYTYTRLSPTVDSMELETSNSVASASWAYVRLELIWSCALYDLSTLGLKWLSNGEEDEIDKACRWIFMCKYKWPVTLKPPFAPTKHITVPTEAVRAGDFHSGHAQTYLGKPAIGWRNSSLLTKQSSFQMGLWCPVMWPDHCESLWARTALLEQLFGTAKKGLCRWPTVGKALPVICSAICRAYRWCLIG